MNKYVQRGLVMVGALAASAGAMAQAVGPDLTALTDAVKFDTVTAAVLSIAGMLALVYVTVKGVSIVISMIRSGR